MFSNSGSTFIKYISSPNTKITNETELGELYNDRVLLEMHRYGSLNKKTAWDFLVHKWLVVDEKNVTEQSKQSMQYILSWEDAPFLPM